MNESATYYISSGAQGKMYTLRMRWTEYVSRDRTTVRDGHIKTLSNDPILAAQKAEEYTGQHFDPPTFDLGAIHHRDSDTVREEAKKFRGGKYEGRDAQNVAREDLSYCIWFAAKRTHSQRDRYTIEYLMELPEIVAGLNERKQEEERKQERETNLDPRLLAALETMGTTQAAIFEMDDWSDYRFNAKGSDILRSFILQWIRNGTLSEKQWSVIDRMVNKQESDWVGTVGEKIVVEGSVVFSTEIETRYGSSKLVKIEDRQGNVFVWFGSGRDAWKLERGMEIVLAGTVKDHDRYDGARQTKLSRCKIQS
jgi:hypothetical protein